MAEYVTASGAFVFPFDYISRMVTTIIADVYSP